LQSIENELAIAREIQTSIIPSKSPELGDLRITAAYLPTTYAAVEFSLKFHAFHNVASITWRGEDDAVTHACPEPKALR
jgi:hypothetical protein